MAPTEIVIAGVRTITKSGRFQVRSRVSPAISSRDCCRRSSIRSIRAVRGHVSSGKRVIGHVSCLPACVRPSSPWKNNRSPHCLGVISWLWALYFVTPVTSF
ncbi:hypothetical protein Naga_101907g2 [Nannochloropsis gaditana]|uniref:Uncharacterized protein n=1 Tax=Nannochloropsis gaditana TaxID=72520 RepID=W7TAE4_9STRA|nr:hypothetical protein Naga_101907g2 [Nannochloropsis gaditana]